MSDPLTAINRHISSYCESTAIYCLTCSDATTTCFELHCCHHQHHLEGLKGFTFSRLVSNAGKPSFHSCPAPPPEYHCIDFYAMVPLRVLWHGFYPCRETHPPCRETPDWQTLCDKILHCQFVIRYYIANCLPYCQPYC